MAGKLGNLSFLSRFLNSLLHTSFDDTPASCLQQLFAWKERMVIYQELSGEQLPESVMISVALSGLKEKQGTFCFFILMETASLVILETF